MSAEVVKVGTPGPRPSDTEWDKLTPQAQATVCMLVGLREGRTMNELAERLQLAVNGVLDLVTVSDTGKISGPKGNVKLTIEVVPNDDRGETVKLLERVEGKHPEERDHTLYVGRMGTLHTTQQHREEMPSLFALRRLSDGGHEVARTYDEGEPTEQLPYRDE